MPCQVEEKITFDEYWSDPRFQYKKPIMNGSLVQMYGDNFYHTNSGGDEWIQEMSAHSVVNKEKHLKNDTGGEFVLIARNYFYLGDNTIPIPEEFIDICKKGPGMKYKGLEEIGSEFIKWVQNNCEIRGKW